MRAENTHHGIAGRWPGQVTLASLTYRPLESRSHRAVLRTDPVTDSPPTWQATASRAPARTVPAARSRVEAFHRWLTVPATCTAAWARHAAARAALGQDTYASDT